MTRQVAVIIWALFAFGGAAHGEGCDAQSNQMQLNMCSRDKYLAADKALNKAYQKLSAAYVALDKQAKADNPKHEAFAPALKATQRAWIALRDTECELEALGSQGGSIRPLIQNECLERMTKSRVSWIEKKLNCDDGDMTCLQLTDSAD